MKPELKTKILNLLKTEKQTKLQLVDKIDGQYCYCIEGIFALALRGEVVSQSNQGEEEDGEEEYTNYYLSVNGLKETDSIEDYVLRDNGIPTQISIDLIRETLKDDNLITDLEINGKKVINWISLNDDFGVTFEQFEKLIEVM